MGISNFYEIDLSSSSSVETLKALKEGDLIRVGKNGLFGDVFIVKKDPVTEKLFIGSGVKFDRVRRVTGYLTGSLSRFNDAKKAEVQDRIVHMHMRPRVSKFNATALN